ncbi:MAG: Leucine aminopeptidase 1 [Phylliscum demangeonii]|nr:MAG: Leucine aminopeptidase 1 [Phylliscum demangeonii]
MKVLYTLLILTGSWIAFASSPPAADALPQNGHEQAPLGLTPEEQDRYLIELQPGETRWVTEEEKWALKRASRAGLNFMDITDTPHLGRTMHALAARKPVTYPPQARLQDDVFPLAKNLSKSNMHENLERLTSFYTRYYKSPSGVQSAEWLLGRINASIFESGAAATGSHIRRFEHAWGQPSLIVTIPGKSNKTVVIGAHQDSINLFLPALLAAPGADDDGSGTVTIIEALRVLLRSDKIRKGEAENTVEFHWYSAEEGGLLGSQAIFSAYEQAGREVVAMLQQDMTGYVQKTLDAGLQESVGVIEDFVDLALTDFVKTIITTVSPDPDPDPDPDPATAAELLYCDIPYVTTRCGYGCSDHASAYKAGYPSAFVIESDFRFSDDHIHTTDDVLAYLSFDHMLQHAKLTLGLVYELAFAHFE